MMIDEINNRIQQEKDRHARVINRLKKEICKENEHYQRSIEYWQHKKEQARKKNQYETLEELIEKCLK